MRTASVPYSATMLHEDRLEPMVRGVLAGDPRAWGQFWLAMDPTIEIIADRYRLCSRAADRRDGRRDVVVRVMERLREGDFSRLRTFHELLLRRDGSFRAWLSVMTRRTAMNHVRDHAERVAEDASEAERRWIELLPLPEGIEEATPASTRSAQIAEATRIQTYVEASFPPAQQKALRLWLMGHSRDEIAGELGLPEPKHADLLVRSTLMHLRRRFSQP